MWGRWGGICTIPVHDCLEGGGGGGGGICTVPVHDCLEGGGDGVGVFLQYQYMTV